MKLINSEDVKPRMKFWYTAGVVVRGQVKRHLIDMILSHGLEYAIEEDKGLLESLYTFTVWGPLSQLEQFSSKILNELKALEVDA